MEVKSENMLSLLDMEPEQVLAHCESVKAMLNDFETNISGQASLSLNFQCEECSFLFSNEESLREHVKTLHSKSKQIIEQCDVVTEILEGLQMNLIEEQTCLHNFPCENCSALFLTEQSLSSHVRNKHIRSEQMIMQCDVVKAMLNEFKSSLMEKEPLPLDFSCRDCPASFNTEQLLISHTKFTHSKESGNKVKTCKIVLKKLNVSDVTELLASSKKQTYLKLVSPGESVKKIKDSRASSKKQTYLKEIFNQRDSVKEVNESLAISENQTNLKAKVLNQKESSCKEVKKSNKKYLNGKKLKSVSCTLCPAVFVKPYGLKRHMERIHIQSASWLCPLCSKSFHSNSNLANHSKNVHSTFVGKCKMCSKTFSKLTYLQRHMNTVHLKLNKSKCHICLKEFNAMTYLQRHMNTVHLKLNKSKCHICLKEFSAKGDRDKHIKLVHLGKKDFICAICNNSFGKKNTITKHILRHLRKMLI